MEYYVVGGEFTSLNFHSFLPGTAQIYGPFSTREAAEHEWRKWSEYYRSLASYRFLITESVSNANRSESTS